MTVSELRLELEKFDQDRQIKFDCRDEDGCQMYFTDARIDNTHDQKYVIIEPF